ncbi:hypothetical protein [Nocardioides nematodiphilus]|uniref:hypothetical protein n=1 Tax=Nocardioides nematodiphilus TaxID=2849669 RepID=UPI001CD99D50|nr:hypothetical protein [Nocardioides nematodiphilus]MCA1984179.1 hypothetical protein [Nocardioides nematodiphilus]
MTWNSYHTRGEILSTVIKTADQRQDGRLPMDVEGVTAKFDDEFDLLTTLQLKWHTRLAGNLERQLSEQPMDLRAAAIAAWHATAAEMPGVRIILDRYLEHPLDARMATAMRKSTAKEHLLLAVMAGMGSYADELAIPAGRRIAEEARASYVPAPVVLERPTLLSRLRSALAA